MRTTIGFPDDPMREWFEQHRRMVEGLRLHEFALQQERMLEGVRNLQRIEEQARLVSEQFRSLNVPLLAVANAAEQLRIGRVQEQLLRDAIALRDTFAHRLSAISDFEANARQMAELVGSVAAPWFGAMDPGTLGLLQDIAGRVTTGLENRADGEEIFLDEIVSLSSDELKRIPKQERSRIDLWQLLMVVLTIYFGVSARMASRAASADFQAAVEKAEAGHQAEIGTLEEISETLSDLLRMAIASSHLTEDVSSTHQVTRLRHLRESATSQARSMMVLERGTEVRVVMHSGTWVAVAIEVEDTPIIGWVDGRYLKELP